MLLVGTHTRWWALNSFNVIFYMKHYLTVLFYWFYRAQPNNVLGIKWNVITNLKYFCFAEILPDALKTQCTKCNATQKNAALKVVDRLQRDYDKEWKQLLDKWDPKREYFQKFQQFLAEEKKKGVVKF